MNWWDRSWQIHFMYDHKQADLRSDRVWFQPRVCMLPVSLSLLLRYHCSCLFFFFFGSAHGMQDLSSLPRDWTHAPCSGSAKLFPADHQGNPSSWSQRGLVPAAYRSPPRCQVQAPEAAAGFPSREEDQPLGKSVCALPHSGHHSRWLFPHQIHSTATCYFHFIIHHEHLLMLMYFNLYKDCITTL